MKFIIFSKNEWHKRFARKQQLAMALAKIGHQVVYYNPPREIWRIPLKEGIRDFYLLFIGKGQNVQKITIKPRLRFLPGERFPLIRYFDRWIFKRFVNQKKRSDFMVFYHPWDLYLMKMFKNKAVRIFDWTEDWSIYYRSIQHKQRLNLARFQEKMIAEADIVFCVSKFLYDKAILLNKKSHIIHNATALPGLDKKHLPQSFWDYISRPRIGFAGHLGPWFDFDLFLDVALKLPKYSFILVGDVLNDLKWRIKEMPPNVYWKGFLEYEYLPEFYRECDTLIAPYRKDISGDPSKIYDYLFLGKPIVSTLTDSTICFKDFIYLAHDSDSFVEYLKNGIKEDNKAKRNDRIKWAKKQTWSERAQLVLNILKENR